MTDQIDYTSFTDEALIILLQQGDNRVFDEIYKRYGQKLFRYFFKMLWQDKERAEDFTQDLFLKLIKNKAIFDKDRNFNTWIFSIAHNMCKNEYRKQEVRLKFNKMKEDVHTINAHNPDLERFTLALHECTDALPPQKKELYFLRIVENYTIPQIAVIMDVPEGTVKSRIFNLLKEMREHLKQFEGLLSYP
ncbi:MAG TPA: RNA polymerase sigma factor [Ferruginibacter sp.]|nr:RNA polymerase sigma factor [Ferruginibacter sp.]